MAETKTVTDHDEIRTWAAARMGVPAIRPAIPSIGKGAPVLEIVFDQRAYQDQDEGYDRSPTSGDIELVEWGEWFEEFDRRRLALVIADEEPGRLDSFHEIIARARD